MLNLTLLTSFGAETLTEQCTFGADIKNLPLGSLISKKFRLKIKLNMKNRALKRPVTYKLLRRYRDSIKIFQLTY
jgi:hypothetical protein